MSFTFDPALPLALAFGLGVITQAWLLIKDRADRGDLKTARNLFLFSLLAILPGKHERLEEYRLVFHLFLSYCFFVVTFGPYFRKKILPEISCDTLLLWNLLFLYAVREALIANPLFAGAVALVSLALLANAFLHVHAYAGWRAFFYVCFLLMLIGVGSAFWNFSSAGYFFGQEASVSFETLLGALLSGFSFFYLAVHVWYVLELIPWPAKHQSFADRLKEVKDEAAQMGDLYEDRWMPRTKMALMVLVVGVALFGDALAHVLPDTLLINLPFVSMSFLVGPLSAAT